MYIPSRTSTFPIALMLVFSGPLLAQLKTVTSTTCTKANLTRYVYLREDSRDRAVCDVLYAKPDETRSITAEWKAANQPGFCKKNYQQFINKLEIEFGWTCLAKQSVQTSNGTSNTSNTSTNTGSPIKRILGNGHVTITHPDGTVVEKFNGGSRTTYPDGTGTSALLSQAQFPLPPLPPTNSLESEWLARTADSLLLAIKVLVDYDEPSVNAYLNSEPGNNLYGKIDSRIKTIGRLR